MTTMTYKEQLLHPNWQRRRLEVLQRDNFACQCCQDTQSTLHVHHKRYAKGRMAWEYPDTELVTLCETCHQANHEETEEMHALIAALPVEGQGCLGDAIALMSGWANGQQDLALSAAFKKTPIEYMAGEVANRLIASLTGNQLLAVRDGVVTAPDWVVSAACDVFAAELCANFDTSKPDGWRAQAL